MQKFIAVLAVVLGVAIAQDTPYEDLPVVPGMDFVGFGYDVRYLDDPNQGLRLPLMEFSFDTQKTYKYPLYRDRVYKVPEELFVRTVGSAVAMNYEFSTIEDYKENWAAGLGFKYHKGNSDAVKPDQSKVNPDANEAATAKDDAGSQGAGQGATAPSGGSGNSTANNQAGYQDILPSKYSGEASGVFEVGVDFQFKKNLMKNKDAIVVTNRQHHQLYQLMVNKQKVRSGMRAAINELRGKMYADEPTLFKSFMEKYGTHYVQSAMLGGAIELESVSSNSMETDFIQTTANVSIFFGTNKTSLDNNTQGEKLERNSPRCTGDKNGYAWNTFYEECQVPPEATCFSLMMNGSEPVGDDFDWVDTEIAPSAEGGWNPATITPEYKEAMKWLVGPLTATAIECFELPGGATDCNFNEAAKYTIAFNGPENTRNTLRINPEQQTENNPGRGVFRHVKFSNPGLVQFSVYPLNNDAKKLAANAVGFNFRLAYDGDRSEANDDKFITRIFLAGSGNSQVNYLCILNDPANTEQGQTGSKRCAEIRTGAWTYVGIEMNWETYKLNLWYKNYVTDDEWRLHKDSVSGAFTKDYPLMTKATGVDRVDIFSTYRSPIVHLDDIKFCNDAGGSKYQPMSKGVATRKTVANSRRTIGGQIDFGFEQSTIGKKISESSNYKLKGGDSSLVDLLNIRNKLDTFTQWKATIPQNPAPVGFTLRSVAVLFPNELEHAPPKSPSDTVGPLVNPRNEMLAAIEEFLNTKEEGEILYTRAADQPTYFELSGSAFPPAIDPSFSFP